MDSLPHDPDAEPPDLTTCDREPIHTPGHIQPYGVLVATAPGGLRISHVSLNAHTALGLRVARVESQQGYENSVKSPGLKIFVSERWLQGVSLGMIK